MAGGEGFSKSAAIVFELSKWIIVFMVAILLVHLYIATIFMVDGASMDQTLRSGEVLLVNRLAYLVNNPKRGDIVILRFPGDPKAKYVKRLIGLPGETVTIEQGYFYVNGIKLRETYLTPESITPENNYPRYKLQKNEYFVAGDNREVSSDSRVWGAAKKEDFFGKTRLIVYPFSDFSYVPDVVY